jgi:hypothetical protein
MRMLVYGVTLKEAMIEAGFTDYVEFSHTFKTYAGENPRAYWEQTAKEQAPLEQALMKKRMRRWNQLKRLLLLFHEGKATENDLMKVRELDREVGLRVSIETIDEVS